MTAKFSPARCRELDELRAKATPGPWHVEGGHILGSDSVHTHGHLRNEAGYSNASYSDKVCTINGNVCPPQDALDPVVPAANAAYIAAIHDLHAQLDCAREIMRKQHEALKQIAADCRIGTWQCEHCGAGDPISDMDLCGIARDALSLLPTEHDDDRNAVEKDKAEVYAQLEALAKKWTEDVNQHATDDWSEAWRDAHCDCAAELRALIEGKEKNNG